MKFDRSGLDVEQMHNKFKKELSSFFIFILSSLENMNSI